MSSPPLTQNIQDITTSQLEALLDRPLSLDDIEDSTHGMSVTEVLEEMAKCRVETKDIELRCLRLMKSRGIGINILHSLQGMLIPSPTWSSFQRTTERTFGTSIHPFFYNVHPALIRHHQLRNVLRYVLLSRPSRTRSLLCG